MTACHDCDYEISPTSSPASTLPASSMIYCHACQMWIFYYFWSWCDRSQLTAVPCAWYRPRTLQKGLMNAKYIYEDTGGQIWGQASTWTTKKWNQPNEYGVIYSKPCWRHTDLCHCACHQQDEYVMRRIDSAVLFAGNIDRLAAGRSERTIWRMCWETETNGEGSALNSDGDGTRIAHR